MKRVISVIFGTTSVIDLEVCLDTGEIEITHLNGKFDISPEYIVMKDLPASEFSILKGVLKDQGGRIIPTVKN